MWKHFNILWNRGTKKKYADIGKLFRFIILLLILFYIGTGRLLAEEKMIPLEIIVLSEQEVYTRSFHVNLEINFKDTACYNDSLYVSYHLVDPKTKSPIVFENPRIKVPKPLDDSLAKVEADVSLEEFTRYQTIILQFDIVDEANAFWFSDKKNIQMPEVTYIDDEWKAIISGIKKEIMDAPIIFGINIMVTSIFVATAISVKNKRLI